MLTISVEKLGDLAVVRCRGRVVRGQEVHALRTAVVAEKQSRTIVLDLTEVQSFDAGGLNTLVSLHTWAAGRGVQFKLANPSSFVYQLLRRTQLDRVLDISTFHRALFFLSGAECNRAHHAVSASALPA
ncbi:MAG TPA: STAS domain-containing protein [Terriglobales bacterium]|nr:STAS domain-containing protein [Terriglobales bacterium]